jgi:outer membrane biosynthesis protein TonB
MAALLLSACATGGQSCLKKSSAGNQPTDFGSDEAAKAYAALPKPIFKVDQKSQAIQIVKQVTDALSTYDMTAKGETAFLRRRLGASQKLGDKTSVSTDVERLIALDQLFPNEGPYLRRTIATATASSSGSRYDRDAQPLIRFPPRMSPAALRGNRSGHCKLEFDVTSDGRVENIRVGYCTSEVFRETSVKSLSKWKYNPAIQDGKGVPRKNVETTIAYRIQDACGNTLPF